MKMSEEGLTKKRRNIATAARARIGAANQEHGHIGQKLRQGRAYRQALVDQLWHERRMRRERH